MSAETKKEILVEYPIDIVYNTLVNLFPVKYYKLIECNPIIHYLRIIDSFNPGFVMDIRLKEYTTNTTIINFFANYPHAIMDLTKGGTQVIETVLEELLNQLDKQPKSANYKTEDSDIEIVNLENFVNTTKNKTHTLTITIGYLLCFLSFVLSIIAIINYDPDNLFIFTLFYIGIILLTIEISISVILQYYEDSKSKLHGRIQICICGFLLIILGLIIHPSLIIGGILIPTLAIIYFLKRESLT